MGGLGILNLEIMNIALMVKWFRKMETEDGLWQSVLVNKYMTDECISRCKKKLGDSQFWTGLLKVKDIFYKFVKKNWEMGVKLDFGKPYG